MATAILKAIVSADTAAASGQLTAFGAKLDALGTGGTSSLNRLQTAGKLAFAALGVAAIAFGASSVKAFQEAQLVMAQTEAVLKSTGGAAGVTAQDVQGLADSLSKLSGVDDEAVQSMENMLLTFTNIKNEVGAGNDIFNQATAATLDLSVALGKDLSSSAILVGKALNDPVRGMTLLQKAGVSFTQTQKDMVAAMVASGDVMGAQKIILAELNKEFGGSAKAAGDTFAGALGKLSTAFGNLQESIGGALIPVLQVMAGVLTTLVNAFNLIPGPIKTAMLAAVALGGVLVGLGLVMNTLKTSLGGLGLSFSSVVTGLKSVASSIIPLIASSPLARVGVIGLAAALGAMGASAITSAIQTAEYKAAVESIIGVLQTGTVTVEQLVAAIKNDPGIPSWAKDTFTAEVKAAGAATEQERLAIQALANSAPAATSALSGLKTITDGLTAAADAARLAELGLAGGFLGIAASSQAAQQAETQLNTAQAAVNKLVKDGKKGTAEYKTAMDQLHSAQLNAVSSQLSLAQSVANYIQTQHNGQATQKQAIADVKGFAAAAGLTKGQTDALIKSVLGLIGDYKQLPAAKKTTVTAPGILTAIGQVDRFSSALNNIDTNIDVYITSHYSSTGTPGRSGGIQFAQGGVIGVASGAFITRGPTVIAGEGAYPTMAGRGAEMVMPMGGPGGRLVKRFIGESVREAMGSQTYARPPVEVTLNFHGTVIGNSREFEDSVNHAITHVMANQRPL